MMKRCEKPIIALIVAVVLLCASLALCACDRDKKDTDTVYIGTTALIERAVRGEYNYDKIGRASCRERVYVSG